MARVINEAAARCIDGKTLRDVLVENVAIVGKQPIDNVERAVDRNLVAPYLSFTVCGSMPELSWTG